MLVNDGDTTVISEGIFLKARKFSKLFISSFLFSFFGFSDLNLRVEELKWQVGLSLS